MSRFRPNVIVDGAQAWEEGMNLLETVTALFLMLLFLPLSVDCDAPCRVHVSFILF